jgi:1-acyl-sn-glycerol-3-phosphate acyltransferase
MPYKPGRPLIDTSFFFRAASHLTFYPCEALGYAFYRCYYHSRITGRSKLIPLKKAILVSNHTTFLDPVLMSAAVIFRRTYHTLLEATVKAPFLGTFTRLLGGVPVPGGRDGPERMIEGCRAALQQFRYIHFYPEGECYLYSRDVRRFRQGAFLAAARLDVPVVPLATIFHEGLPGTARPRIELAVLDPLYPKDFIAYNNEGEIVPESVSAFSRAARQAIQAEIDKRGGTGKYFKGRMARIEGLNAED